MNINVLIKIWKYKRKYKSISENVWVRPYFGNTINECKNSGQWKNQLIVNVDFSSSKDDYETRLMLSKSDNIKVMIDSDTNETI